jgi:hypothetical protein
MPLFRRVSSIVAVAALVTSLALAVPASADQAFHTQRIPLSPVADAPLKSGAVIDIHTQGPTIYAQERYVLIGAEVETTYQVTLLVYSDPGCAALLFPIPTATMTTNTAGTRTGRRPSTRRTSRAFPARPTTSTGRSASRAVRSPTAPGAFP